MVLHELLIECFHVTIAARKGVRCSANGGSSPLGVVQLLDFHIHLVRHILSIYEDTFHHIVMNLIDINLDEIAWWVGTVDDSR